MNDGRQYYKLSNSKVLQPFLRNVVISLGIHWIFQGILCMDWAERFFKLALDVVITVTVTVIFTEYTKMSLTQAFCIAGVVAHTLNFLFNAQICVVLKHFQIVKCSREEFEDYIRQITERATAEPSIIYAAAYGSIVRGSWRPSSDLDVRLVRQPGWTNGLRGCLFVLLERTRALLCGFPLDVYLLDDFEGLGRLRADEEPLILLDTTQSSR